MSAPSTFTQSPKFQAFSEEKKYLYLERIGILCGDKEPTKEEHEIALWEIDEL